MPRPVSKDRQQKQLLTAVRTADWDSVKNLSTYAKPIGAKIVESVFKHPDALCAKILSPLLPHLDPRDRHCAFKLAVAYKQKATFDALLPVVDPAHNFSEALRIAAYKGHLQMVKRLLPVSDQSALDHIILKDTATAYRWNVFDILVQQIKIADLPKPLVQEVIQSAASSGRFEVLAAFLPYKSYQLNPASVIVAAQDGRRDLVDVLYPHTDVSYLPQMLDVALQRHDIAHDDYLYVLHHKDHQTHKVITQEVSGLGQSQRGRKI